MSEEQYTYRVYTTGTFNISESDGPNDMIQKMCGHISEDELQKIINEDFGELDNDLAQFIWEKDKIHGIVTEIPAPIVMECPHDGTFLLGWTIVTNKILIPEEEKAVMDYIGGQCSDGWGEGFEQQELKEEEGEYELEEDCYDCGGTSFLDFDESDDPKNDCVTCEGVGTVIETYPCKVYTYASPWASKESIFNIHIARIK